MSEDDEININDPRRQRRKKKKRPSQRAYRPPHLKVREKKEDEPENKIPTEEELLDAKQMLLKIYAMHADIASKLEFIERNKSVLPEELLIAAESPEKIIQDHDLIIEKFEKSLEEKISSILGTSIYLGEKKKAKKEKYGRGVQKLRVKKNWLPM